MNVKALLFLIISNVSFAQNFEITYPNTDHIHLAESQDQKNDEDYKMQFQFNNYENKFFVMNKLLFGNKTAKSLLYIKFLNIYAVSNRRQVNFYGFKELFPKNGFYKTGEQKIFFGEKCEAYQLENDISAIKLWFTDGVQTENEMYNYFKDLNLLTNIPKNKKLVAVSLREIDFNNNTAEKNQKSFSRSSLENFVWGSSKPEYGTCMKNFRDNRTLSPESLAIPKEINFTYKTSESFKGKDIDNQYYSFSDDSRNHYLRITKDKETGESKAYYYDPANNFVLPGTLEGNTFSYSEAYKLNDTCHGSEYKKIEENDDHVLILKYPVEGPYELSLYEVQKKNAPKFFYNDLQVSGFLKSIKTINNQLDEYQFTSNLEKVNTKITFVKK